MHDELALLRQLREAVGRLADDLDRAIIQRENRIAEARAERRRRHFKLVAIPIGVGVAAAATRAWISRNVQTIAVAGASGAIASGAMAAVLVPQISSPPDHADAAQQPPVTVPAPTRPDKSPAPGKSRRPAKPNPAPTTPPKPAPTSPAPAPSTGTPLVGTIPSVHMKPPKIHPLHPLHPTPGGPRGHSEPSEDAADSAQESCRVHLPNLGICLLPGRRVR